MNTPEAEQLFSRLSETFPRGSLTHSAIVVGDSQIKKWQLDKMNEKVENYSIRVFIKMKDAELWLSTHVYIIPG